MLRTLKCLISVFALCVFGACSHENESGKKDLHQTQIDSSFTYSGYVYHIKASNAFGYIIRKGQRNLIHQTFLPAMPGRMPMTDSLTAIRLMERSIGKLQNGQFPPSLTLKEVLEVLGQE